MRRRDAARRNVGIGNQLDVSNIKFLLTKIHFKKILYYASQRK